MPPLLLDAARERRDRFLARENDLGGELARYYATTLGDYRTNLQRSFDQFYTLSDDPDKPEPVWDFIKAKRHGAPKALADDFDAAIDGAEDETAELLDTALPEGYDDGREEALYLLALLGLTPSEVPDADPEILMDELLQAGVDGESWADRLSTWTSTYADKFRAGLTGAMVTGATLAATLDLFDRLSSQLTGRVVGLGQQELFRADAMGAEDVLAPLVASGEIVEVWVTRGDSLVCPLCQALHLTITAQRPGDATHPNCRCLKVPYSDLSDKDRATVQDFAAFQQGRR